MMQRWLCVVEWTLKRHAAVTAVFIAVVILGAYPNYKVSSDLQRGPVDNALPEGDAWRAWQEYPNKIPNFRTGELVQMVYILDAQEQSDEKKFRNALAKVYSLEKKLHEIPGITVIGLTTSKEYTEDCGEEFCDVKAIPYLREHDTADGADNETWRARVETNPSVHSILTCKNTACLAFGVKLEYKDRDEMWLIDQIALVLEERNSYAWWERMFWKTDIYPRDPHLHAVGYPLLRWHITKALRFDILVKTQLGIVLASAGFLFFLKSIRQTAIAVLVNIVGGIWVTRVCVWLLSFFIPRVGEDVYAVLDYAMIVVFGFGFPLRLFYAFRNAGAELSQEKFMQAAQIGYAWIYGIALISMGPFFLSMPVTLSVWQMVQLGIMCSISIALIGFVLVPIVTPAVYLTWEELWKKEQNHLRCWEETKYGFADRLLVSNIQIRPIVALLVPVAVFSAAAYLYASGGIVFSTQPVDYVQNTLFARSSRKLEKQGYGNNILPLHVGPPSKALEIQRFVNDLRDGAFEHWQKDRFGSAVPVMHAASVLDSVAQIAGAVHKKPFPTQSTELSDILFLIQGSTEERIWQWLWSKEGFRVLVLLTTNDSAEFRQLILLILTYAKERYPPLEIVPFEKGIAYPQSDWLVTRGEGANVSLSFFILFACYAMVLWRMNKTRSAWRVQPLGGAAALVAPF
ncbi:MAG: hypothetical protein AAB710_02410, partial [Patescibacteria group bacterium]